MTYIRRANGTPYTGKPSQIRRQPQRKNFHAMGRGLDQKFVAIDGEAFENGYCLLDSSLEHPRLYRDRELRPMEVFDWLWELGSRSECKDVDFILFGGGYDFNNWLHHALHFDRELHTADYICRDHRCLCRLCAGDYVLVGDSAHGPYQVQWLRGYKFTIRKYHQTIRRKWGIAKEVNIWDSQPFFQCSFVDALKKYGIEVPQIIMDGKDARGSFKHAQIEWVSQYNKLECKLLIDLLEKLKESFHYARINISSWNGPGAAAKAKLRAENVKEHNGRDNKGRGQYLVPDVLLEAMLSAYAGGMCRCLQIGSLRTAFVNDINSAYPYQLTQVPCLTHGTWHHSKTYRSGFGVWKIVYQNPNPRSTDWIEPLFTREKGDIYYLPYCERWAYSCEVDAVKRRHPERLRVLEGWYWEPAPCEKPHPFNWVHREAMIRLQWKYGGLVGAALVLKLALNAIYGSLAQARGSLGLTDAPWSQQLLWAGWVTAATRMKLWSAAMQEPASVIHMATDGLITSKPLSLRYTDKLGDWESDTLSDLTVVQYGVYFHEKDQRTRGFAPLGLEPTRDLVVNIRQAWERGSGYRTIAYPFHAFVTAHEVRQGISGFDDWCKWEDRFKQLDVAYAHSSFYDEARTWPKGYSMVPIEDRENWSQIFAQSGPVSEPYSPKWGTSYDWPVQFDDDPELIAV